MAERIVKLMGFEEIYELVNKDLPMVDVCRIVRNQFLEEREEGVTKDCRRCPLGWTQECELDEVECAEVGRGALRRVLRETEGRLKEENKGESPQGLKAMIDKSEEEAGDGALVFMEEIKKMFQEIDRDNGGD